ncbi:hypothetical protein AB0E78_26090 [Streptomyces sp. NPDC032198]|uniref:hypothetical protein n=1 Tax=Streptomyces sp. NPDC032198 TaxID=3155127 RepID=UPI0033DEBEC8
MADLPPHGLRADFTTTFHTPHSTLQRGTMIKVAGFFEELSPGWGLPTSGSIREFTNPAGVPDEDRITSYLRNSTGIWSEMSAGPDVLDPDAPLLSGIGSLYTDGEWLWREDLAYYVETYHITLPGEFVSRIRSFTYNPPEIETDRLLSIMTDDLHIPMA